MQFTIKIAEASDFRHAETICQMMADAAAVRKTGIAKRKPEYIRLKMEEGKAILALDGELPIGFCYIESWQDKNYVSNSGLIVHPDYRGYGLAGAIKEKAFELSRTMFPQARLFGITTSPAVMKINSRLGYQPVAFADLTKDDEFWKGCQGCTNYDILQRTESTMCLCTGMVYVPTEAPAPSKVKTYAERGKKWLFKRGKANKKKQKSKPITTPPHV